MQSKIKLEIRKLTLAIFLLISITNYSQKHTSGFEVCIALKGFNSSTEAENALDKIISTVGISKNFVMQECPNVSNAAALQVKGVRYVFYNKEWMSTISDSSYDGLFILAHEVGHHVNGHTLDWVVLASNAVSPTSLAEDREQELQADEFAGFVMAKLGASLDEACAVINRVSKDSDDKYSTHPSRSKRIIAIKKGFENGSQNTNENHNNTNNYNNDKILIFDDGSRWEGPIKRTENKAQQDGIKGTMIYKYPEGNGIMYNIDGSVYKGTYYDKRKSGYGELYYTNGDVYKGQWLNGEKSGIGQLIKKNGIVVTLINGVSEKRIEAEKFFKLGDEKATAEDYNGAIADYTKAISLDPNYDQAYWNRADAKMDLKDYKGAILDLNKSISIFQFYYSYNLRGIAKFHLEDYKGAIADYSKTLDLFDLDTVDIDNKIIKAEIIANRGICKQILDDYKASIEDFNKAIELDNTKNIYYYSRGECKYNLSQYVGAAEDYSKAIEIDGTVDYYYSSRGECSFYLMNYNEAIEDYNKAIQLNPESDATYLLRARAKSKINDNTACSDLRKAHELDVEFTDEDNSLMLKVCR